MPPKPHASSSYIRQTPHFQRESSKTRALDSDGSLEHRCSSAPFCHDDVAINMPIVFKDSGEGSISCEIVAGNPDALNRARMPECRLHRRKQANYNASRMLHLTLHTTNQIGTDVATEPGLRESLPLKRMPGVPHSTRGAHQGTSHARFHPRARKIWVATNRHLG